MEFNATFFVSVISFIVFTILMDKILYAPISDVTSARQKMIDELLIGAKNSNDEASKLIAEKEEKLLRSSEESRKIIADKVEKANKRAELLTVNAKNASFEEISLKKEELLKNESSVKDELKNVSEQLADDIVSKILG